MSVCRGLLSGSASRAQMTKGRLLLTYYNIRHVFILHSFLLSKSMLYSESSGRTLAGGIITG